MSAVKNCSDCADGAIKIRAPRKSEFRRGISRIISCPLAWRHIADGIDLSADEAWTVAHTLQWEFGPVLHTTGPQDYAGRVWEVAAQLKKAGRPVNVFTVWASAQGKVRTWDIREMANAISVPRPKKGRKTQAETAKLLAMRPIRLEVAAATNDNDTWEPGILLEEHLAGDTPFPAPDHETSSWERHFYSADNTRGTLRAVLAHENHPGAYLLMEILTRLDESAPGQDAPALGPAMGAVARQHGLRVKEALASITEFAQGIGADSPTILSVLRGRGEYAKKPAAA